MLCRLSICRSVDGTVRRYDLRFGKLHSDTIASEPVIIPYSRKLSQVKTFANFAVLPASANFNARGLGERVGFSKTRKFYSRNALLYRIHESFQPRKFPAIRYCLISIC